MRPQICLIVDDESSVRAYVKAILVRKQFQIIEAENGIQGLQLAQKLGDALDLIVSDIQMPNGDGFTFVCAVRESLPTLPIVLISGFADSEQTKHPNTSFEFVQKPFSPTTLLSAIDSATNAMKRRKKVTPTE